MLTLIADITNPVLPAGFGRDEADQAVAFGNYIVLLWRALIVLGGLAALLFLIWGAFDWIMAGGDEGKVTAAKKKITQSIIGLVLLASTVAIVNLVEDLLGIQLLTITFPTPVNIGTPVGPSGGGGTGIPGGAVPPAGDFKFN